MSTFENLSTVDRAEVDTAIRQAYIDEDGSVRTKAAATEEFLTWLAGATQAQREYADAFRAEWEREGAGAFIHGHWRTMRVVPFRRSDGVVEVRPGNRGTRRVDESGRQQWTQTPLDMWDADALLRGIAEAARRIESERTTIANYRRLLDLLERTGCTLVHEALDAVGQTLDEYLEAVADAGSAGPFLLLAVAYAFAIGVLATAPWWQVWLAASPALVALPVLARGRRDRVVDVEPRAYAQAVRRLHGGAR